MVERRAIRNFSAHREATVCHSHRNDTSSLVAHALNGNRVHGNEPVKEFSQTTENKYEKNSCTKYRQTMNSARAAHYDFTSVWVCVCEKLVSCLTFAHNPMCKQAWIQRDCCHKQPLRFISHSVCCFWVSIIIRLPLVWLPSAAHATR